MNLKPTLLEDLHALASGWEEHCPAEATALRAVLAAHADEVGTEYAIESLRDGIQRCESLDDARDQMQMFYSKPGRGRIVQSEVIASDWRPLV